MKKTVKIVVAMALILSLCLPMINGGKAEAARAGYYFTYKGASITMGSKAKKFLKKAGDPISKNKKKSCAYKGYDYTRKYPGFTLSTYTNSSTGPEIVNCITFLDGSVSTNEGIHIGSTESEMKSAYGDGSSISGIYSYVKGKTKLQIQVVSGAVKLIRYVKLK
ncbi:MAG: hypothetical protein IKQ97_06765 [Eubacterium sp.]|nr:hypothetical protein [Eubacterium sp.]